MKRMLAMLVMLSVCAMVSSSADAYYRPKSGSQKAKAEAAKKERVKNPKKLTIPVFSNDVAPQPYVIIGKISYEKGSNIGRCEEKLGKFAVKKHDADAILNFKMIHVHLCEGIAVRWAKDGEAGLVKISENTPVPVVEGKKVTFRWF